MKILVLNCGSSSIKYKLFDMEHRAVMAQGGIEKLGLKDSFIKFTLPDGTMTADNDAGAVTLPDGRRIYMAVLVKDTRLGTKENARLIREITEAIIRQETNNNHKNR